MIDLTLVGGWFPFEEYYRSVYNRLRPNSRVFEIGVYEGRSTLYFADLIRCGTKPIEFHCCDIFLEGNRPEYAVGYWDKFNANVERFDLGNYIHIHKGKSVDVLANFTDKYFDFVYIDGDHECVPVFDDVSMSLKKLRVGGILAGHDQSWPSVQCGLGKAKIGWRVFDGDVWEANLAWLI